jgi:hypothetical protein
MLRPLRRVTADGGRDGYEARGDDGGVYQLLARSELLSITGTRRYIPGSEMIRRSTLPAHDAV